MTNVTDAQKITSVAYIRRKSFISAGFLIIVLIYVIYIFFALDMNGLVKRAKFENAKTWLLTVGHIKNI